MHLKEMIRHANYGKVAAQYTFPRSEHFKMAISGDTDIIGCSRNESGIYCVTTTQKLLLDDHIWVYIVHANELNKHLNDNWLACPVTNSPNEFLMISDVPF